MIDKLFPRVLNSSKDNRLRQRTEMNDALNVVATDDFNEIQDQNDGGNSGVLKPAKGNVAQPIKTFELDSIFPTDPQTARRVIGQVSDPRAGVVYMFVFSERATEMGVYAYDAYGFFPGNDESYRPIYTTSEFQFSSTGRVKGDVVHITGPNDTFRPILYFTDDENEPRKLDVLRCVDSLSYNPDGSFGYVQNSVDDKDFITACPKAPMHPIQFSWDPAPDATRPTSNFRRIPGMQFAFQCVYTSGDVSALSTYSDIAVPPQYVQQGYSTTQLNLPSYLELVIPSNVLGVFNFTQEVERVRILVRQGNIGGWYEIDEVDVAADPELPVVYNFYNDRVLKGLTEEEQNRDFEALPKIAQAVAVVENRLMYGNYVEGFDEEPFSATVDVNYVDRPQEFINVNIQATPVVVPLGLSNNDLNGDQTRLQQRVAGVALNLTEVPNNLPVNSLITAIISFDFGGSVEVYDATKSFHASASIADNRAATNAQCFDTDNSYFTGNFFSAGDVVASDKPVPLVSCSPGVSEGLRWRSTAEAVDLGATLNSDCRVGVSGVAPLRFRGPDGVNEQLTFSVTLRSTQTVNDAQNVVRTALLNALGFAEAIGPFEIIDISDTASYSFNLNLKDPTDNSLYNEAIENGTPDSEDILSLGKLTLGTQNQNQSLTNSIVRSPSPEYGIIPAQNAAHRDVAKLITMVDRDDNNPDNLVDSFFNNRGPRGWVVVNQATLSFKLRPQRGVFEDELGSLVFTLELSDVSNADIRTCIPVLDSLSSKFGADYGGGGSISQPGRFKGWRVFSGQYLKENSIFDLGTADPKDLSAVFADLSLGDNQPLALSQRACYAGYMETVDTQNNANPSIIPGGNLYVTNQQRRITDGVPDNEPFSDVIGGSLVDGEIHPAIFQGRFRDDIEEVGGNGTRSGFVFGENVSGYTSPEIGCYGTMATLFNYGLWGTQWNRGELSDNAAFILDGEEPLSGQVSLFNTFERLGGELLFNEGVGNINTSPFGDTPVYQLTATDVNGPQPETAADVFISQQELTSTFRSFKTNATHALGVVYYDERGRPGNVNPIDPVFVAGYSPEERNGVGVQGRVEMEVTINSDPPEWAHFYQLVYGGSSTVQSFIQYSAGGAFIATSGEQEQVSNIYVSLNYLQNHPTVSYAEAFGAVHPDGTSDLYVFTPGDYLRVISYFTDPITQEFPQNMVFEIAGQVTLGNDPETNPLYEGLDGGGDVPDNLQGQFLILKNNQSATGFDFNSVAAAGNFQQATTSHFWNNRCIFEIITPRRQADTEDQVYRETSQVYNVGRATAQNIYHQVPVINFVNGDVWWRAVPVNTNEFTASGFENLISASDDVDNDFINRPRFRNVYLETRTFNDTFPAADVNGFGKIKVYRADSAEVRRFSSVTFSDENRYSVPRIRFTTFNPSLAPFKDLPNEHGAINALLNYSDSLFVVQEDKASMVPVNRQIISDALGSNTLIATAKVLGDQKLLPGHAGADNNRESVIKVDDTVYFAHKGRNEVYRYLPGKGIQVISEAGLNAYFVDAFEDIGFGPLARVVSGYDSLKDEYIITIMLAQPLVDPAINEYRQPNVSQFGTADDDGAVNPGGTDDGVVDIDFNGVYEEAITEEIDNIIDIAGTAPDGVAPTDGFPPPNGGGVNGSDSGILDVALENKDKIIEALGGGVSGFPNPTDSTAYPIIGSPTVDAVNSIFNIGVNVGAVLPTGVMSTLGDFNILNGTFDSASGVATFSVPFAEVFAAGGNPQVYAGQQLGRTPTVAITETNYTTYLDANEQLVGNLSLIEALSVRRFYLEDKVKRVIAGVKNDNEQNIVDAVASMKNDLDAITDNLIELDLNNDPNFAVLIDSMNDGYDALSDHVNFVLGAGNPYFITLQSGEQLPVVGFGNFSESDYPLTAVEFNALQQINTLVDAIAAPVNALSSSGIDISSTLQNLLNENASLRGNVDVLADQVQALSDAPSNFGVGNFIPGVNSNQLESVTINNLSGDGVLSFNDVVRDFDPLLQFLIDNNAVVETIIDEVIVEVGTPLTNELAARLVIEVIANLAEQQGFTDRGDATSPSVQNQAFNMSTLRNLANETSAENAMLSYLAVLDPANITGGAGVTIQDLLGALAEFNEPSASGIGVVNSFQPSQPFQFTGEAVFIHLNNYVSATYPLDVLIESADQLSRDFFEDIQAPQGEQYPLFYIYARAILKNLLEGRFVNPTLPTIFDPETFTGGPSFMTPYPPNPDDDVEDLSAYYAGFLATFVDPNVPPVEFGWEDPRLSNAGTLGSTLTVGEISYNGLPDDIPAMQRWFSAGGGVFRGVYNTVRQFFIEAIQEGATTPSFTTPRYVNPGTTARVVEKIAQVRSASLTQYFNSLAAPSPLSRFGNSLDAVAITPEQRDQALADAVNYINNS